jgi:hypothetical protein
MSSKSSEEQTMSEALLFEIPEVRITTERLVVNETIFAVNEIASTDVSPQMTGWGFWSLFFIFVPAAAYVLPTNSGTWEGFAIVCVCVYLMIFLRDVFPKQYVLRITRTDKMFYEIITRTHEEATILQEFINEAMKRSKQG